MTVSVSRRGTGRDRRPRLEIAQEQLPRISEALEAGGIHYDIAGADQQSVLRNIVALVKLPPQADRDFLAAKGASDATLKQIVASLPPCPCGGRFDAGACQKCPRCGYVFARPSLPVHRLTDACVMLIEGASFLREPKAGSVS